MGLRCAESSGTEDRSIQQRGDHEAYDQPPATLTSVIDPLGRVMTYSYDANGETGSTWKTVGVGHRHQRADVHL